MRQIAIGTFDNFNIVGRRRQRRARGRHRLIYDTLLMLGARRSVERIRPARRSRQLSGRFLLGLLPAARRSEMARRQAGDAGGRDLFLQCVQEIQSAARRLLSPRRQGRENRRSRGHLHLRRARQSRTAADRRPAYRSCRKHWWEGTDKNGKKRDIGATTLEPPLGSGPTASRSSRPAATSSTSA